MCNTPRYSESGKPCGVQRCEEYEALKQERDALLKVREAADVLVEVIGLYPMVEGGRTEDAYKAYKEARDG